MSTYFVYIFANRARTLYTGVTNNLVRRVHEHRERLTLGFTSVHGINRLVYFEPADAPRAAIEREKEIKSWVRRKKVALINDHNPEWRDLAEDLGFERLKEGTSKVIVRKQTVD
ncbi:MAG TPA: GIY-YIG nuclease family protein [Longimicrobium sp.]|uniref:GIY-YIG nuclease family protein n=1 Tax=Longimicrobium sp. TaxID=2029185 RepID=UPI002EDB3268